MDRADNQDNYEMHPSLVSVRPEWECQEDKEFLSAARMLIVYSTQEVFGGRTQSHYSCRNLASVTAIYQTSR